VAKGAPIEETRGESVAERWHVRPARYARGKVAFGVERVDPTAWFMGRMARLCAVAGRGRYTHRERAYIMSPTAAARVLKLYAEGWDASPIRGELTAPKEK
jgi:hypothetical protein